MGAILKGIGSVLIALGIIAIAGTGIILYYNNFNTNDDEIALTADANLEETGAQGEALDVNTLQNGTNAVLEGSEEVNPIDGADGTANGDGSNGIADIAGHTHSFQTKELEPATCSKVGTMEYSCYCGLSYTEAIPMLEHKPGDWAMTKPATDDEAGLEVKACTVCGQIIEQKIIPVGGVSENGHRHDYDVVVTTEATCTEPGEKTYTCKSCGNQFTTKIAALNHPSRRTMVTEGNCSSPGSIETICNVCGLTISNEALTYDHKWSKWKTVKKATKDEEGSKTRTCSRCNSTETQVLPKTGDSDDKDDDKKSDSSSSTDSGSSTSGSSSSGSSSSGSSSGGSSSGGSSSSSGGSSSSDSSSSTPLCMTHTFEKDNNKSYAATCTEDGMNYLKCSKCGKVTTETLPATGSHSVIPYPTISIDGMIQYKCSVCKKITYEYPVHEENHKCKHSGKNYVKVSAKSVTPTRTNPVGYDYYKCAVSGCDGYYTVQTVYSPTS